MNILLTGANGFLGKSILNEIFKSHSVRTLSRSVGDYKVSLEREIPTFEENFDVVIHAAGKAHVVPKTESEKKEFHDVNVVGTLNLLKGLENNISVKQFVFISSVSVYGMETGMEINENSNLSASDAYGLSKIQAEKEILEWCNNNNVICTILRLPLLVGENPPGNLRSMIKAINKGIYFNIDNGKARKSMILTKDVTIFIFKILSIGGIYNLTDDTHPSFYELSRSISNNKKKYFSLPLPLAKAFGVIGDFIGEKAPINSSKVKKITSDLTFDNSKAKQTVNWNPISVLKYIEENDIKGE